jgi:hypothetical protein
MAWLPRIRLRTIFLFFFCAAVGLTCGIAPPEPVDPTFGAWIYVPKLNWHYALLAVASVAMVIGLGQQALQLVHSEFSGGDNAAEYRFARQFGIAWRVAIAALLAACLAMRLLLSRQVIRFPERNDIVFVDIVPDCIWAICIVIVLSNSVARWRRNGAGHADPLWRHLAVWSLGIAYALVALPDTGLIQFLVHVATEGIESAQPLFCQRAGVFPDQTKEGFRLFWLCAGSVVCVFISGFLLTTWQRVGGRTRRIAKIASQLILLPAAVFCIWFYNFEYARVSPDLGSVGFAAVWFEWLGGAVLAAVAISVGAYQLACLNDAIKVADIRSTTSEGETFHETCAIQFVLIAAVVIFVVENVRIWVSPTFWRSVTVIDVIGGVFYDSLTMLYLAITLLNIQLAWLRWRRRNETIAGELVQLDGVEYFWTWLSLAALLVVAIPLLRAASFIIWFGPFTQ